MPVVCRLLLFFMLLTSPAGAQDAAGDAAGDAALAELMNVFWNSEIRDRPTLGGLRTALTYPDRLDRVSPEAFAERRARMDDAAKRLALIDRAALTDAGRTNYDLFDWYLSASRPLLDLPTRFLVFNSFSSWHTGLQSLARQTPLRTPKDYTAFVRRFSETGRLAAEQIARLEAGMAQGYVHPCDVVEGYEATVLVPDTVEESFLYSAVERMPASFDAATRTQIARALSDVIENIVTPAYRRYREFLQETYLPACRDSHGIGALEGGAEAYREWVRYYSTLGDMTPDRVHDIGLSEVARIRSEMQAIVEEVGFDGDLQAFFQFMKTNPAFFTTDRQVYVARVAEIAKRIDRQLPAFFAVQPRNRFTITPIPDEIAPRTTIAYYNPGSAAAGVAGQYFINLHDLGSKSLVELPALGLHEASPGHHWQTSLQQELGTLPQIRRDFYISAFGEGWGLYSEYLGIEMGLYTTPYEHFARLTFEMWRALRLVVDTGIHAKGWSRQQAIDYMDANSSLALSNISNEVDRYITWPGQAIAYKLGELKIKALRREAETALGADFSLRDWHTHLLASGSLPLAVLETRMKAWLDRRR